MNPQDPLANLYPLREPLPIGWWPPAPGWWLLSAIGLACLAALAWFLYRRYRANAYRRRALAQLARLQEQQRQHPDTGLYLARTNALLKSVALLAYPRRDIAAASGEQWLAFLNGSFRSGERFQADFVTGAYRRECPGIDTQQVYRAAEAWIRRHEVAR